WTSKRSTTKRARATPRNPPRGNDVTSPAASSPEIGAAGFESGRTLYFPCFDAFRFFGMTMVLVVHATFATRPWVQAHLPDWLQAVLERMDVGVAVFFVISGF